MNSKFVILALAALISCALSAPMPEGDEFDDGISELAVFEKDEVETANLGSDKQVFSDFCLNSRDHVKNYMKMSMNDAASRVFNVMFSTVGDVAADLSRVQAQAVQEGVEIIKNSGIEAREDDGHKVNKAEVEQVIESNANKVRGGLLAAISDAVRVVLNAVISTITSETSKRLALLKNQFNAENAREQIESACQGISRSLKRELEKMLSQTKRELLAAGQGLENRNVVERANLADVGCTTTSRINKLARFCDTLVGVGPIFYPLIGL